MKSLLFVFLYLFCIEKACAGPGAELVGGGYVLVISDQLRAQKTEEGAWVEGDSLWTLNVTVNGRLLKGRGCYLMREKVIAVSVYCPNQKGFSLGGAMWMWDPLESTCRHASLSIL